MEFHHYSVLLNETIENLNIRPDGIYVDGTLGGARATLSTVAFRGTGPSHTQVVWNGMRINSPMLGMTDFSMIPSYFVDDAQLLHGT